MKLISVKVSITKRLQQYESATFGGEWTISETDNISEEQAFAEAVAFCDIAYNNYLNRDSKPVAKAESTPVAKPVAKATESTPVAKPVAKATESTPVAKPTKEKLVITDPRLTAITKRIADGVSLEEVLKHFAVDKQMYDILRIAALEGQGTTPPPTYEDMVAKGVITE